MPRCRSPRPRSTGLIVVLALFAGTATARADFDGRTWWETVKVLADDRFQGRETGSVGEHAAQDYLIHRLRGVHIEGAGVGGFRQPVELRSREIVESASSVALIGASEPQPLTIGEELVLSARVPLAPSVDAPLVFAGYGLVIPEIGHDDFAGLDLNGKVVVIISGAPAVVPSAMAAHHQALGERWHALRRAGAIGLITLQNPGSIEVAWARVALNRSQISMHLVGAEFDEAAGAQFAATFNPAHGELLFKGSGHTFAELAALAEGRAPLPRFELPLRLKARLRVVETDVHSNNVVARVPGSDPALRAEYVVLSAHLDHLGVGEPVNGDRIYNGAMDNASGSALLLELARALAESPAKPKRSVLFLWLTGEEKGLLGSRYFAAHPTVPIGSIVADLNVDMFLPIVPLTRVTVLGLEESDLGDRATEVAGRLGLAVQPDPEPLHNHFIRSDQYNFIRRGIPALMMDVGAAPGSAEADVFRRWRAAHYHAPSDDAHQVVDLGAAGRFEDLMLALTRQVADAQARPAWKPESPFARPAAPAAGR